MFVKPFRNILSDLSGNVGAIFAVMAVPVMIIIGGSVDVLRISNSEAKLQSAVESGVLAAASLNSTQSVEDAVNDYIKANLDDDANIENLKITVENATLSLNKRVVEVKAEAEIPHFWKWWNFNPWCPDASSAALWNTNEADDLKDRIASITLSDGTGMDHGILWGAKALSPSFKGKLGGDFPQRPNAFNDPNEDVQKIMVLMTDGGITFQGRPKNPAKNNVHTNRPNNNPPTTDIPNQGNGKNQQVLLWHGHLGSGPVNLRL